MDKKIKEKLILITKLLLFLAIVLFIWSPLHEKMHMYALQLMGMEYTFNGSLLHPMVTCTSCDNATNIQRFWYSFTPYVLDLLMILLGALFFETKLWRYLMHLGYADIVGNYIALVFYFWNRNIAHDFIIMARIGFWYVPILLFVVSTSIWFSVNWYLLNQKLHEIKMIYRKNKRD